MSRERVTALGLAIGLGALLGLVSAPIAAPSWARTSLLGCSSTASVALRLQSEHADALVTIDDEYVGKLGEIARRSIKLPPGTYRITIEKVGYFPFDRIIEAEGEAMMVAVDLEKIPD